ncbi:MAG: hypothetical protein A2X18_09780 [Bacteroidetes bacterium GWF2_40_14]|nr:MAG: hypothetical protein A2X18_09780 [Bacteroidetes bacterium GWF2_40_14]
MKRKRRYEFVTSPLFLGLFLVLYFVSALYLPVENSERWIPALIGFVDLESLPPDLSITLGTIFIILTSISLYVFNERNLMIGQRGILFPIVYLIFSITTPKSIFFSGVSVASLFVVWSLYYTMFSKKGDMELFISGFLISIAALFDPHVTLLFPLIIFFALRSAVVTPRAVAIVAGSLVIPFAFMLSFRYLFFQDALFFIEIFISDLTSIDYPSLRLMSVSDIIVTLSLFLYLMFAVSYALNNMNRYKILKSHSFSRFISLLLLCVLIVLFYPQSGEGLTQIIAIPVSVLVLEYVSSPEKPSKKKVGFLLVLIFLVINRISCFI